VKAVGAGDKSVGTTLMELLGVDHTTTSKARFMGVVVSARRGTRSRQGNRVNLFAKVPDWDVSACKSTREIVERYGYRRDGGMKLYATLRARQPNPQGLLLSVDRGKGLLREQHSAAGTVEEVAAWRLESLKTRLLRSHPESAWVVANVIERGGIEYFHYRYVRFTHAPRATELPSLLEQGTVTVDHLIFAKDGRATDKGPLFRIKPSNVRALFPTSPKYDLMAL
jgi:hypothetical protein